ncbi:restriction endonuclease subunit S [Brachyspira aalborgi]|uniref:Type I restriction endonuclease subunit S n=1 Tax=Brachyspira aalborgi TaxID=29522 RepID=A0A5C8G3M8_9SPIR|nr:restriction endonuclease subunit S [Brachyspira aalborgi]TXJ56504.1 type I restriction endonuclease subunit S [Brachyspira aalborgi]
MFYKSKKFENKKLSDLVNIQKGETITSNTKEDGDIPVIAGGKVPAYYNNKSNYKGNVITISASGSSGYVWWHDNPIWASDCNVLTEKSKEANIKYIYHILKFNQENIYKLQKGSVQSHVYASDLAEIIIPTPPIEIQQKIVNEINERKQKALRLQKEAKEILENAKSQVERIIF